jgi:hypothetical protein
VPVPSPSGIGLGLGRALHRLKNPGHYAISLAQYVKIRESQDPNPMGFQIHRSSLVSLDSIWLEVLPSVNLNRKS